MSRLVGACLEKFPRSEVINTCRGPYTKVYEACEKHGGKRVKKTKYLKSFHTERQLSRLSEMRDGN